MLLPQQERAEVPISSSPSGFAVKVLRAPKEILLLEEEWQRCRNKEERPSVDQKLQALAMEPGLRPGQHLRVVALYQEGALMSAAPLIVREHWHLKWSLSKIGLRRPLVRWNLRLAEFCGPGFLGVTNREAAGHLLKGMIDACQDCDVIRCDQLSIDSALYRLVTETAVQRGRRWLRRSRDSSNRWLLRIKGSFDEYLHKFTHKRRQQLKAEVRRLEEHFAGQVTLLRAVDRSTFTTFKKAANDISSHSWQGTRLHAGLETRLEALADRGCLRSYLLMGGEQPLAFLIGRQADRVFVSDLTGFDTRFEGFSPGKVMWNKVIQDLHEHGGFRWIDFGTGDIGYKQFWGHEFYRESSVYLIKPGLRTAAAFWPIMAVMWPVNVGRSLCEALSLGSAFDRTLHRLTKALKRRTRNW